MDYETEQLQGRRGLDLLAGHIRGLRRPALVALGIGAAAVLTLLLLSVMALAREPELSPAVSPAWASGVQVAVADGPGTVFWLVLDSARPVDEVLPPLEQILKQLKLEGAIVDFDPTPQRSDPTAVPAIRVVAAPGAYDLLRRLPGVLDAVAALPPPPPGTGGIGAMAVSGAITGVVTAADSGQPLQLNPWGWPMSAVRIYDAVSFAHLGDTDTSASGQYQIAVTAPYSQAKVYVSPPAGYLSLWYDGKAFFSEADAVALQSGSTVTGVNLALARSGSISVTLSLDGGGAPPIGVYVNAYEADDEWAGGGYCSADSAGHCVLSDLVPGAIKLKFWGGAFPGIVEEWYEDQETHQSATPITVASGVTTSISAQVSWGGRGKLRGTVTEEGSGSELSGVTIFAHDDPSSSHWCDSTGGGMFPSGEYECELPTGRYRVEFAPDSLWHQREYYDNASTLETADWVTITAGMTTTVDAALTPYTRTGAITGTITKDGGQPLESGEVVHVNLDSVAAGGAHGTAVEFYDWMTVYSATVPVGTYWVFFSVDNGDMIEEWYNDASDNSVADIVTVTEGGVTPDISADLASWGPGLEHGCIRGRLTSNGLPVEGGVVVEACGTELLVDPWGDTYRHCRFDDYIESYENGMYEICDLVTGDYMVSFMQFPWATTWYSNALSPGDATTVTVAANTTTYDVDGTLDNLGACISGRVVDVQGQGVSGVDLSVRDATGDPRPVWWGDWDTRPYGPTTDEDGGFVACGLQPGTYTIEVSGETGSGTAQTTVGIGEAKDVGNVVIAASRIYLPLVLRQYP
jgi:hypothetical protein